MEVKWIFLVFVALHVKLALTRYYKQVDLCYTTESLWIQDTFLMLECLRLCENEPSCRMFRREGKTCFLYPQPDNSWCETTQMTGYFLVQHDNRCQNAGYFLNDSCVCVHGYVGDRCDTMMTSCSEGLNSGSYDGFDGVLPVHPDTLDRPFFVHCNMASDGRLYVQFREDTTLNFFRSWVDMTEGVGSVTGDHWLGNRHLYALLASQDMDLTVSYTIMNGSSYTRTYTHFNIKDEEHDFAIESYTATYGNLGSDCLASVVGIGFSAVDHDVDFITWWSCAFEHRGSWWYKICEVPQYGFLGTPAQCNPNGPIVKTSDGLRQDRQDVFWIDFPFAAYKTHIWLTDSIS